MVCKNCGKEFDGKFCPDCGSMVEEEVQQGLTQCPQCGAERIGNGKFCVSCGYDFESRRTNPRNGVAKPSKALGVIAKVYRWLLAGGMLLVGIVSLLCLTAPTLVESFFGETNPLCTGFNAIGGKEVDVPSSVVNASILLLVVALIALIYGVAQLVLAIKKPYIGIKKYVMWAIDGVISIMLVVVGAIVASATKSEELMEAKLGTGFVMCIVIGVFGLVFLGARVFYELKVFKWEDIGESTYQSIVKSQSERKKLTKKQIMAIFIPVVAVAVLIAVIVPTVIWSNNIFRVGKVDKVDIGDSQEQVIKILGEPYKKYDYTYEYYSDNYLKVAKQLDKIRENEFNAGGVTLLAKDDEFDFDEDDFDWDDGEDKETQLKEQLHKMTYQYICVEFDSDKKVKSVFFDAERCDSKEDDKKTVKSSKLANKKVMCYVAIDLVYKSKYTDGSFYKGIVHKNYVPKYETTIKWTDIWENQCSASLEVKDNPNILYADNCGDTASYELRPNGELIISGYGAVDKKIDMYLLYKYSGDITVKIGSGITSIYYAPFSEIGSKVISIEIPSSVTSIGNSAFYECKGLTSIEIPSSVTSIGDSAFFECSSLTSIEIPSSVTEIGREAFAFCSNLTSIEIPSSVTSIGSRAFSYCRSLTSIEIPSSVTSIGEYTFSSCSSLTSIEIPNSVTSIGSYAFSYCRSLTSIEIPSSVTSIDSYAFQGCDNLTIYCEDESQPKGWATRWNPDKRPVEWGYKIK